MLRGRHSRVLWLEKAFGDAEEGELYVFPSLRLNSNLSTTAKKIVLRAKVEPWIGKTWVNFFNSLRASTETDLMDKHGLRRACQWAGNSAATAMKNYALVRKSDFQGAGFLNSAIVPLHVERIHDSEWAKQRLVVRQCFLKILHYKSNLIDFR